MHSEQFRMSGLKQKRSGNEVENQSTIKKTRESISYEDLSPSLLEVDTQPMDEKKEERKMPLFPPSYSSQQNEVSLLKWTDMSTNKRVRVIITPLGSKRLEFRVFTGQETTEKGIFLDENQWHELKRHLFKLEAAFSTFLSYREENFYRSNLGRLHYIEFDSRLPCIQLRKNYEDSKTKMKRPTRQSVTFSMGELQEFKKLIPSLEEAITATLPASYE